jgi:hypothetical protein
MIIGNIQKEYRECLLGIALMDTERPEYDREVARAIRLRREIQKKEDHPVARWRRIMGLG